MTQGNSTSADTDTEREPFANVLGRFELAKVAGMRYGCVQVIYVNEQKTIFCVASAAGCIENREFSQAPQRNPLKSRPHRARLGVFSLEGASRCLDAGRVRFAPLQLSAMIAIRKGHYV